MDISLNNPMRPGELAIFYEATQPFTVLRYGNSSVVNGQLVEHYAGINGTYPPYQRAMGWHDTVSGKTWLVWADDDSPAWAMIAEYDEASGVVTASKKVFRFVDRDAHRNPSIMLDASGYIYVFGGSHGDTTQIWRSASPRSIASFSRKADITGQTTYPQPHDFGQYKRVFLRKGLSWGSIWTGDNFTTVSGFREVVAGASPNGVYAITESEGSDLHIIWTVLNFDTQIRKHVWYAKSANGGIDFSRADGVAASLPIACQSSAFKIFDSGADQVNIQDILITPNGPVILVSHGALGGVWSWKVIRIVSGVPVVSDIPAFGDRQFDCGALLNGGDFLRAILPTGGCEPGEDGGNIEEYRSYDGGGLWVLYSQLTDTNFSHNNVKRVRNANSMLAFWGAGHAQGTEPGHLRFLLSDNRYEALRPGNPFAKTLTVKSGGAIVSSQDIGTAAFSFSVSVSAGIATVNVDDPE